MDLATTQLFFEKLQATIDTGVWEQALSRFEVESTQEDERIRTQLRTLEKVKGNLVASLTTLNHPEMIRSVEKQYQEIEAEQ